MSCAGSNEPWSEDDFRQLEDSIARFERAWHRGSPPDINAFLPDVEHLRLPVLMELVAIDKEFRRGRGEQVLDADYRARFPALTGLSLLKCVGLSEDAPASDREAIAETLSASHTYAHPQWHARGGLGEILVVDDLSLQRRVVVKRLQARWRSNRRALRAFLQEVELTGRLEHPGIVPVHARGETSDGRPWYSMRFVLGETLSQAIQTFHRQDWADRTARVSGLRQLLTNFVTVCNTVAYAHSRGVLHRDLKPANIMLGPFGETLVLDWGMAKMLSPEEDPQRLRFAVEQGEHRELEPKNGQLEAIAAEQGTETSARAWSTAVGFDDTKKASPTQYSGTQQGDLVGTPAYMSPEQARGDDTAFGPATDVFGLGTILYTILTGIAPYPDAKTSDAIRRAADGAYVPPIRRKADVPAPLDAICCRAMARDPQARYASPVDLARDIENWLVGEPVAAWPEPWTQRAARSMRRRRGLMAAAGVSIVVIPLALGLGGWFVAQERARSAIAHQTAEIRGEATRQITDYLTRTFKSADPIPFEDPGFVKANEPSSDATLRRMLDEGFDLLDAHLLNEPALRSQLLVSIGSSYLGLAEYEKARRAIHTSYRLRRKLFGPGARETLESQHYLARIAQEEGRYREAELLYREVIAAREKLSPPEPLLVAETKYHLAWLLFYQPLGLEHPQFHQPAVEEAVQLFMEVLETREALLPANDRSIGFALAGIAAAKQCLPGETLSAATYSARALEVFQHTRQENVLGSILVEYGMAERLRQQNRLHEADAIYQRILEHGRRHLGASHPSVIAHLWNMAGLYRKMGESARAEHVVSEIRSQVKSLAGFRSLPVNVDGLMQYAEALRPIDPHKSREVFCEALQYANERPESNADLIARIEQQLADTGE